MKHIVIYILIAVAIFGFLSSYFSEDSIILPTQDAFVTNTDVPKETQLSVGVLFNGMDDAEKVAFRSSMEEMTADLMAYSYHDCLNDAKVQVTYARRLLSEGCQMLLIEPVNDEVVDTLIDAATEKQVPLVLLKYQPSTEQIKRYENLYAVDFSYEVYDLPLELIADTIAYYWTEHNDEMDTRQFDDVLKIATVSDYDMEESGEIDELQALLTERGVKAKFVYEVVTRYLNYNIESNIDAVYWSHAELILFADSSDAEKAYYYFRDPNEYTKVPPINLAVMNADSNAYNLYHQEKVLFAVDDGGPMMGRVTGKLISGLAQGYRPAFNAEAVTPQNGGRTYLCNPTALRNIFVEEEPETEEAA